MHVIKALLIVIAALIALMALLYHFSKWYVRWYIEKKKQNDEKKLGYERYEIGLADHHTIIKSRTGARAAKRFYIKARKRGDYGRDKMNFNLKNEKLCCKKLN